MISLNYVPQVKLLCEPAVGFQTAGCNCNNIYSAKASMAGIGMDEDHFLGYIRNSRIKDIALKILGYIPVVGIIVGIYRIIQIAPSIGETRNHRIRGMMEIIPVVGTLLIFPDIAITAYRLNKYTGRKDCD